MPDLDNVLKTDMFVTPIWSSKLPNFDQHKESFISCLREKRNIDPQGVFKSNYGGYQSADDLVLEEKLFPLYEFVMNVMVKKIITDCMMSVSSGFIINSWTNFNDKLNAVNLAHSHDGIFSGVFYIKLPEGSGKLILENDGMNDLWRGLGLADKKNIANEHMKTHFPVFAEEGDIYIWQSHVKHFVVPNEKELERISISFNIALNP